MLIVNEDLFDIDDAINKIVENFLNFEQVVKYKKVQADFQADEGLQSKIRLYADKSRKLEDNKEYVAYRTELKELQREVRALQREINLNEHVYALRLAENDLQSLMAELTHDIVETVSESISVDEGLPFSGKKHHGKGGSCGK